MATRFPLEDADSSGKGAGSPRLLAISGFPFGALKPDLGLPWGGEGTRSGAHAPVFPEGGGAEATGEGGGKEKGIPTVESWGPRGRLLSLNCEWCQDRALATLGGGFGARR